MSRYLSFVDNIVALDNSTAFHPLITMNRKDSTKITVMYQLISLLVIQKIDYMKS